MRPLPLTLVFSLGVFLFGAMHVVAWSGPTQTAPNGNVSAPINVGSDAQYKAGDLGVERITVFGDSLLEANSYLNWGTTRGTTGYGMRDNGGTLEFKNSGGLWASLNTMIQNYLVLNGLTLATGNGTFTNNVTAVGFFHSSDARLKINIETSDGSDIISKLRGVVFDWKKDGTKSSGVIAQEVEKVLPSAVHTDVHGFKSVDYDQLIAPLIEAVKEQQTLIDLQQEQINVLRDQIESLQRAR